MISFRQRGSFLKTEKFLNEAKKLQVRSILERYGEIGANALANATPYDTGLTAKSWGYRIVIKNRRFVLEWFNTNVNDRSVIAILIQYGHGTGTGGYVQPFDYINPTMKPIFDKIVDDIWKEVKSL